MEVMDPSAPIIERPGEQRVPPLRNGDVLTRVEFERRYLAMPELKKAELIDGVVYLGSPVSDLHGRYDSLVATWLGHYAIRTPGTTSCSNTSVRLDEVSEPQPDQHLRIDESHGGRCRVEDDRILRGAPELVAETAISSVSYDLHQKLDVYRRHGVPEYVVVLVESAEVRWHRLVDGRYERLVASEATLRSSVFPGLWLDVDALIARDGERLLAALERGLASPEHGAFVRRLAGSSAR